MQIRYYTDPGHGWGKVKLSLLKELKLLAKISFYSYIRGDYAYLEQDCDLPLFVEAMKEQGKIVTFRHYHTDRQSRIRYYNSYMNPLQGEYKHVFK